MIIAPASFTLKFANRRQSQCAHFGKWLFIAAFVPAIIAGAVRRMPRTLCKRKRSGAYRVELHVLPAEPFFSKADVAAKNVKEGMEIEGGAAPVAPDADSHPNHHLVVHVFDKKTSKVLTDATVTMSFVALDAKGQAERCAERSSGRHHAGGWQRAGLHALRQ